MGKPINLDNVNSPKLTFSTKRQAQYYIRYFVNKYHNAKPRMMDNKWAIECTGGRYIHKNKLVF